MENGGFSNHSKRFTILPHIHPFTHTSTHRRRSRPRRATASSPGAVRVRCLAQGHLEHLLPVTDPMRVRQEGIGERVEDMQQLMNTGGNRTRAAALRNCATRTSTRAPPVTSIFIFCFIKKQQSYESDLGSLLWCVCSAVFVCVCTRVCVCYSEACVNDMTHRS